MQTFTRKEYEYLQALRARKVSNDFKHQVEPLDKPMTVEERKLRSRIKKKCNFYIFELALAEYCGVLPSKLMIENGFATVCKAISGLSWSLILNDMKSAKPGTSLLSEQRH